MSLVNEAVAEWRKSLDVVAEVISSIAETLGIEDRAGQFDSDTQLLDNLAELDSMAIVELVLALEQRFGIEIDDSEITGEMFESVGSLAGFVASQLGGG